VFLARERAAAGGIRHVALKVIRSQLENDPSFGEMFIREGNVALGLRHPNICHVYRFGIERGHYFIAMELVQGVTVLDLLVAAAKNGKSIPPALAAKIVSVVAEALHSAHVAKDERGRPLKVVHQDVSPHNVMIAHDGTVKLLDFGVAQTAQEKAPAEASKEPSHTTIRGKFAYLSPEQCTGSKVDARSDVFSLGIVLYELLTGKRLYKRGNSYETLQAIVADPLPSLEGVPAPLVPVLQKALAKAPRDRFQTAEEMQEAIEEGLAQRKSPMTSGRIAQAVAEILGPAAKRQAAIDARPEVVAWIGGEDRASISIPPAPPIPRVDVPAATPEPPPRRTAPIAIAVGIGVAAVAAIAIAAFAWPGGGEAPAPSTAPVVAAPAPVAAPAVDPAPVVAAPELPPVEAPEPAARTEREPDSTREARHRRRSARRAAPGGFVDDPGF
jgi:serine/threonine-protein kinase